jgi:hypothetical protein
LVLATVGDRGVCLSPLRATPLTILLHEKRGLWNLEN